MGRCSALTRCCNAEEGHLLLNQAASVQVRLGYYLISLKRSWSSEKTNKGYWDKSVNTTDQRRSAPENNENNLVYLTTKTSKSATGTTGKKKKISEQRTDPCYLWPYDLLKFEYNEVSFLKKWSLIVFFKMIIFCQKRFTRFIQICILWTWLLRKEDLENLNLLRRTP